MTTIYIFRKRTAYFISETRWFKKLKRKADRIPEPLAWSLLAFALWVGLVLSVIGSIPE